MAGSTPQTPAENHPPESPLANRVLASAAWLAASRWSMRLVGLASTALLARLLTPDDFGIMVLAATSVALLEVLTNARFGVALVHYTDATRDEYDTAWTFNIARGIAIAAILFAGSWLLAWMYDEPRLVEVFWALGVIAVVNGLTNIGIIHFTKELRFQREFAMQVSERLIAIVVTLGVAWWLRSYWALLAGNLAAACVRLALSYLLHPYRPRVHFHSWHRLVGFSSWLMGGQVISFLNQRLEQFFMGAFLPISSVGTYHVAYEAASMATSELVTPATQALFPGYSIIKDDKERLRAAYLRSLQFIVALGSPAGVGLALVAPEFVALLYGPKWDAVVYPLQVLCCLFSLTLLSMASTSVLPALGRTREMFGIDAKLFVVHAPVTLLLVWQWGIIGAAWARFASGSWWAVNYMIVVRRVLDVSFRSVAVATWRSYASVLGMAAAVLSLDRVAVFFESERAIVAMSMTWSALAIKAFVGATTYFALHFLLWNIERRPNGPEKEIILFVRQRLAR